MYNRSYFNGRSMPKYNADGVVIDVTLNTVKVRNWDNTITTIPPYALVSDSFQNWRGMHESGGRRVKRSINIDMNSVKFCTPEMLEKFRKIALLKDYIEETEGKLKAYNQECGVDDSVLVNGQRQTNLGVFRAYLERYLRSLSAVNQEMHLMVRHLQPTEKGIPMELYFFSISKVWVEYETLQADVMDHETSLKLRYDFNYCTFSYSMAFWDWKRWEQEIDWMALHGINLPLAVVGEECVWFNMLKKLGYSKEEINKFISGPAFMVGKIWC